MLRKVQQRNKTKLHHDTIHHPCLEDAENISDGLSIAMGADNHRQTRDSGEPAQAHVRRKVALISSEAWTSSHNGTADLA